MYESLSQVLGTKDEGMEREKVYCIRDANQQNGTHLDTNCSSLNAYKIYTLELGSAIKENIQ